MRSPIVPPAGRRALPRAAAGLLAAAFPLFCLGGCPPPREVVRPDELRATVPGATALVVVYSRSGNTARMARALARVLGADYLRIEGSSPGTFLGAPSWTKQVEIKPEKVDLSPYRLVLVGGPIWEWRPNALTTSFIRANDFSGKDVVLFYTFQGGKMSPEVEAGWKQMVADRGGRVVDLVGIDRTALPEGATVEGEAERLGREKLASWTGPEQALPPPAAPPGKPGAPPSAGP